MHGAALPQAPLRDHHLPSLYQYPPSECLDPTKDIQASPRNFISPLRGPRGPAADRRRSEPDCTLRRWLNTGERAWEMAQLHIKHLKPSLKLVIYIVIMSVPSFPLLLRGHRWSVVSASLRADQLPSAERSGSRRAAGTNRRARSDAPSYHHDSPRSYAAHLLAGTGATRTRVRHRCGPVECQRRSSW